MSFEKENRQAIIAYFEQGARGNASSKKLGVEVEHFVVHEHSRKALSYEGDAHFGVRDILAYLSDYYPRKMQGVEGDLIGLADDEASLTLEPAAQLEISIAPFEDIREIVRVYKRFRSLVDPFLEQHQCKLITLGYHPTEKALDLSLIPKQRYRFMNEYFRALGTHGERMMRASASTQVSVDYSDEADAVRKLRVAQALVPMIAFLTDNVERFEGEVPERPLSRLQMWRDVDNDRCGQIPGLFDEDFGFASYADWLLSTCPIFVTRASVADPQGPALREVNGLTAAEAYADAPMSTEDIEHLLSMFWPDVRLKHFVEIRPADALPIDAVAGYAALIKGIFYSSESLDCIEEAFGVLEGLWPLSSDYTESAAETIRENGLQATICEMRLEDWLELLFKVAQEALQRMDCAEECTYLADFKSWSKNKV